jgi:hypothetical protein
VLEGVDEVATIKPSSLAIVSAGGANASEFDETELRTIFWFFLAVMGTESVGSLARWLESRGGKDG